MRRSLSSLVILLLVASAGACRREAGRAIATLGPQTIREPDFARFLSVAYPPADLAALERDPTARQRALDAYLDDLAIAARARQLGIDRDERFRKAAALMESKTLAHLFTERHRREIAREVPVSTAAARRYYEEHAGEFLVEPRFTARHVLVYVKGNPAFPERGLDETGARRRADAALRRLRGGAGWEAVARDYSDDVGTSEHGGLIRDARFGHFAPELEQAVRTQPLGRPGEVIRTTFGYAVVQVESRVTEEAPKPFAEVEPMVTLRLAQEQTAAARQSFMAEVARKVGLHLTAAGQRDASLLDERAFSPEEALAEIDGKLVREEDFRWFLRDALLPGQRTAAYARPGARQAMMSSYLDLLALEARARQEGLDESPEFVRGRVLRERNLLSEFMQGRDKVGPFCECVQTDEERQAARQQYFARIRAEVDLRPLPRGG